jgi:hypothetical protein
VLRLALRKRKEAWQGKAEKRRKKGRKKVGMEERRARAGEAEEKRKENGMTLEEPRRGRTEEITKAH